MGNEGRGYDPTDPFELAAACESMRRHDAARLKAYGGSTTRIAGHLSVGPNCLALVPSDRFVTRWCVGVHPRASPTPGRPTWHRRSHSLTLSNRTVNVAESGRRIEANATRRRGKERGRRMENEFVSPFETSDRVHRFHRTLARIHRSVSHYLLDNGVRLIWRSRRRQEWQR
jgi:hypothetical protein